MLWVDKHAPHSFPHLLSDERTNREVLRALRGWDPYVFRKAPPLRPLYQRQKEQERLDEQKNSNTSGYINKYEPGKNKDAVGANSSDKRPEENVRVILLSGPPGVGKWKQIISAGWMLQMISDLPNQLSFTHSRCSFSFFVLKFVF